MHNRESFRSGLVLCVEDEADLRSDIVEELVSAGYSVVEADNGREALKILEKQRPDLILCDITMPGMGGYEFLQTVRDQRADLSDVPFVFLTALVDRKDVIQGKSAGADDYLVKPIDYDVMLATLKSRLAQVARMRRNMTIELERERRSLLEAAVRDGHATLSAVASALDHLSSGVILLDRKARVQYVNRTANQIIAEGDGLTQGPSGLRTTTSATTKALKQAIGDALKTAGSGQMISITRSLRRPLLLQTCSLETRDADDAPAVAIFVVDPEQRPRLTPDAAAKMYGLTPSEARLAAALVDGKRLDEIGQEFGVAPTTISFHLQNLFRKTHTNRQAELAALLIRSALALQLED